MNQIDIEDEIIRLAEAGCSRREIADRVPIHRRQIKMILDEAGHRIQANQAHQINRIWDLPDDKRRAAFAKGSSEGARRTLNVTTGSETED